MTGADIPLDSRIGGGLLLPHPNEVVIHPKSPIGVNCLLFQQVTITGGVTIGGHVDIGAGAKILGPVVVGVMLRIRRECGCHQRRSLQGNGGRHPGPGAAASRLTT